MRIPFHRVKWVTSSFLILTALMSITVVPVHIYRHGLDGFQIGLFFFYLMATGLSITLGYHRLFSHLSFKAKWPVELFVLIFGAAAFENAALDWASEHRKHHKYVDHDDDPYNIQLGFWYAHIGWLLFRIRPKPPIDNVPDLEKNKLVMWQHRYCQRIAVFVGFVIPALLGYWHAGLQGAWTAFLVAGVARVVFVQHMTFFINSLCHYLGRQPYNSNDSSRDSAIMAFFTFGEGYHNYHHSFQHDYRNGVKPWQFDPTKWSIWVLERLGLVSDLRRVPEEKILLAELVEIQRRIDRGLPSHALEGTLSVAGEHAARFAKTTQEAFQLLAQRVLKAKEELQAAIKNKVELSQGALRNYRREVHVILRQLEVLCRSHLA